MIYDDVHVVDLTAGIAGAYCAKLLTDLGADVVKVERPDGGDTARGYDTSARGTSAYFAWLNRGKRSVALDLKKPRDHAACDQLIQRADVVAGEGHLQRGALAFCGFPQAQL